MKKETFDKILKNVIELCHVKREELFTKSKRMDLVQPRYLLYYVCHLENIRVGYIQKYMRENGLEVHHSTIIHGIKTAEENNDKHFIAMVKKIQSKQ